MTAQCPNPECLEHEALLDRSGRSSFGQTYLDEPACPECGETLEVVGGAWVA